MQKKISIIIPVLHESRRINGLIGHLRELKGAGQSELIIVDGSATADTLAAIPPGDALLRLSSAPGRARQMNAGAAGASGAILLFLHADTYLPADALTQIDQLMVAGDYAGGAFDLGIDSPRLIYRLIAATASARSRLTRIPYGDQAIFIAKDVFQRLGGYPDLPIMEDLVLMERIKKRGLRIAIVSRPVTTSPRRWEENGIIRTTFRNWFLLAAYYLGVSPDRLARFLEQAKKLSSATRRKETPRPPGVPDMSQATANDACVLFFVKSPGHVPVKTRLAEAVGVETARELYRNFVLDLGETLAGITAMTGGTLRIYVDPPAAIPDMKAWLGDRQRYLPQEGHDLGERMKNAFLRSFADGYRRAVLLGSDTPDLAGEIVAEALACLAREGAVIGPAHDGGYYLIGFRADAFLPAVFENIPWSTGEVWGATRQAFAAAGRAVSILPPWRDIDTLADLEDFLARHDRDRRSSSHTLSYLRSRGERG